MVRTSGTISGFKQIQVGDAEMPPVPGGKSLAEVYARLDRIQTVVDADAVHHLKVMILEHIQNESNPHRVTVDQIGIDIMETFYQEWLAYGGTGSMDDFKAILFQDNTIASEQDAIEGTSDNLATVRITKGYITNHDTDPNAHGSLLNGVMPGTPPDTMPSCVVRADLATGLLTVVRPSPIHVIDRLGYVTQVERDMAACDYSYGRGMLPLWSERTNTVVRSDPAQSTTCSYLGSTAYVAPDRVPSPDRSVVPRILREDAVYTIHGFTESIQVIQGAETVVSSFVFPLITQGRIRMYIREYPDLSIWYDPVQRTTFCSNANLIPHTVVLPNGWCRLGLQFISPISGTVTLALTAVTAVEAAETPYVGVARDLFSVWGINCTTGAGLAPYIPSSGSPSTLAATTASVAVPALSSQHGIAVFRYIASRQLQYQPRTLLSAGTTFKVSAERDVVRFSMTNTSGSKTITSGGILGALSACAVAYTTNSIHLCVADHDRVADLITPGSIPSNLTVLQLGTFDGYLQDLVTYHTQDTSHVLEYLTGGL